MFSEAGLRLSLHISMHNNLPCICCLTQSPGNIYSFHPVSRSAVSQMRPPLHRERSWRAGPWGKGVSPGFLLFFPQSRPRGVRLAVFVALCRLQSDCGLTGPFNVNGCFSFLIVELRIWGQDQSVPDLLEWPCR